MCCKGEQILRMKTKYEWRPLCKTQQRVNIHEPPFLDNVWYRRLHSSRQPNTLLCARSKVKQPFCGNQRSAMRLLWKQGRGNWKFESCAKKVFVGGGSLRCLKVSSSTRKIEGNWLQREETLFEVASILADCNFNKSYQKLCTRFLVWWHTITKKSYI